MFGYCDYCGGKEELIDGKYCSECKRRLQEISAWAFSKEAGESGSGSRNERNQGKGKVTSNGESYQAGSKKANKPYSILDEVEKIVNELFVSDEWFCPVCGSVWESCLCRPEDLLA
jgi:predicted Fe-S protein YdhL (DUF1289 family)